MAKPVVITDSTFQSEVLNADRLVVVDFWAEWCAPCRMVAPILNEIAEEYSDSVKVAKLNIDENQQYAAQLGVTSIPTMAVFKNGQLVDRIIGAMPKQAILARLKPHMTANATEA